MVSWFLISRGFRCKSLRNPASNGGAENGQARQVGALTLAIIGVIGDKGSVVMGELSSPRRDLIVSLSPPKQRLKRRIEPRGHLRDNNRIEAKWVHQHFSRASMRTDTPSDGSFWSVHGHLALVALISFGGSAIEILDRKSVV